MMKKNLKNTHRKDRKIVNILGINVDSTTKDEVLASVKEKVSYNSIAGNRNTKFYIVTPNPELVLASTKNSLLKSALNGADYAVPDGIGLAQAAKFSSFRTRNIVFTFFQ